MRQFLADYPSPVRSAVLRSVNRWLPDALDPDDDVLRARAHVLLVSIFAAFLALGAVGGLAVLRGDPSLRAVVALATVWFCANLVDLQVTGRVRRAERWFLTGVTWAYFLAVTVTGGIRSPMVAWIPVYPVLFFVIAGLRGGALGLGLGATTVLGWAAADAAGRGWPAVTGPVGDRGLHAIVASTVILVAFGAREQALAALVQERNREQGARFDAEAETRARRGAVAHVSHELRAPLAGVVGLAELLLEDGLVGTPAEHARTIRDTARALLQISSDLQEATRLEVGSLPILHESFDPRELLEQTAALFRRAASAGGTTLRVQVDEAVPARLTGDPYRVRQVLNNLVSNAIKYTRDGEITLTLDLEGPRARWAVSDTGAGIPADQLSAIFGRYVQVDVKRDRALGSGLGLSIARMVVEAMGGALFVESELGVGSRFTFYLRQVPADAPLHPAHVPAHGPALRVLLVDDSAVNRTVVGLTLRHMGHEVTAVADGDAAVAALRAAPIDLVVLDLHLGAEDGASVARRLFAATPDRPPVIVGVTATVDARAEEECLRAGMRTVVTRPVERDVWEQLLADVAPVTPPGGLALA